MDEARTRLLVELQEIDSTVDALRLERDRSPTLAEVQRLERDREALQREIDEQEAERNSMARTQSALERELSVAETKIEAIEDQLYGGEVRSTRELVGLQQELGYLKSVQKSVEARLLEKMIEYEELAGVVSLRRRELGEVDRKLESLRAGWDAEAATFDARISSLMQARASIAADLDDEVLEVYERLRSHLGGVAVASLNGERCTGCNVDISKAAVEEIAGGGSEIPRCENCGRMIIVAAQE